MATIKSLTIKAGECAILPAGATVTAIILDGAATLNSTCNDLPNPTSYQCYDFFFVINDDTDTAHPAGVIDILGFKINEIEYFINFPSYNSSNAQSDKSGGWNADIATYNSTLPGSIRLIAFSRTLDASKRQEYKLTVKLLPQFASSTYMLFQATGFQSTPVLIQPITTTCP